MARTDATHVCIACRARFWPVRRCPLCRESRWLVDLAREPEGFRRLPPPSASVPSVLLAATSMSAGVGALFAVSSGWWLGLELLGGGALVSGVAAAIASRPPPPTKADRAYQVVAGPPALSPRTTLEGVVRRAERVKALAGPVSDAHCVAYVLVGTSSEMPIADARARPFDLELDTGARVRIEAEIATIDLSVVGPPQPLLPGRAEMLRERGVLDLASARVIEAVIREGDRLIVSGALDEEHLADGYRATRPVRRLRDRPGAPLLIRAPVREESASDA